MANNIYGAIALTGGTAGALDAISGAELVDKDMAYVTVAGATYNYMLDADLGVAEASPRHIVPDANAGTKVWVLQKACIDGLDITGGTNTFNLANGTASLDVAPGAVVNIDAGLTVSVAATLTTELHVTAPATHIADATTGLTIAGGTTSKTLTVDVDASITGERAAHTENSEEEIWYSPTGSIVETTAAQTLSNKTLTSPVVDNATASKVAMFNGSKVLGSGSNTDAEIVDAVTKKHSNTADHAQNTDMGTTSTSFIINSGGNEADLRTMGLTADRDYTLPDIDTMLAGAVLMTHNTFEIIAYP